MQTRKHCIRTAVAFLVLVALVSACAKPAPTPTQAPAQAPAKAPASAPAAPAAKKISMVFATVGPTLGMYPATVAWNELVEKNSNLNISVRSCPGSTGQLPAVNQHEAEMGGGITLSTSASAYYGLEEFKGNPLKNLRVAVSLGGLYRTFVTSPRTGIKTVADMKGKRRAEYTAMAEKWVDAILEAYGLDPKKDFKIVTLPDWSAAVNELKAGRLDALHAPLKGQAYFDLKESAGKVVILPLAPEKQALAKTQHPDWMLGFVPAYFNPGEYAPIEVDQPVPVTGVPRVLTAHKDTPDDIVYTYVKTLLEHYKEVQKLSPDLTTFTPQTALVQPEYPYHPGAIKLYKELKMWTPELDKAQAEALKK